MDKAQSVIPILEAEKNQKETEVSLFVLLLVCFPFSVFTNMVPNR